MIKRVSLLRRFPDLSQEDFVAHWSGPHVEIVCQLPGVRGLRLGVVRSWTPDEAAWDGVGEVWFDSVEAAEAAFRAEPFASRLVEDRKASPSEAQSAFVEELTIVRPPS